MENILKDIQQGNILSKEISDNNIFDYLSSIQIENIDPTVMSTVYSYITPELLESLSVEFDIEIEDKEETEKIIEKHFKEIETVIEEKTNTEEIFNSSEKIIKILERPEVFNFIINEITKNETYLNSLEEKFLNEPTLNSYFSNYLTSKENSEVFNYTTETFNTVLNDKIETIHQNTFNEITNLTEVNNEFFTTEIFENLTFENIENVENIIDNSASTLIENLNTKIIEIENSTKEIIPSEISQIFNNPTSIIESISNKIETSIIEAPREAFSNDIIEHISNTNKTNLMHQNTSGDIKEVFESYLTENSVNLNNFESVEKIYNNGDSIVNVEENYDNITNVFNNEYLNMLSSIPQEDSSVIIEKHLHSNVTNIENRFETLKNEIVEMVENKKTSTISKSASNESKADKVKSKSNVNVNLSKGSKEPIVRHLSPAPRKVSPLPDFPLIGYNK